MSNKVSHGYDIWYVRGTSFGKMNKLNWCCELSSCIDPNEAPPQDSHEIKAQGLRPGIVHSSSPVQSMRSMHSCKCSHWHLAVVISWLWLDPCKVPQLDLASLIWTLPWTVLCYMAAWSAFFRPCRTLVSLQSFCWTSWSVFLVWMELGSCGECLTQVSEGVNEPHTTAARTWHSSPLWDVCCCNPWGWLLAFNP